METTIDDLSSIYPDTWQNIPPPLKDAIRLLIKHVISLHSRVTFTYGELSQTHAKVKDLQFRTREDHSLLETMNGQHREEVVKLEEANAACAKLTKEMVDLIESNERRKHSELAELKVQLNDTESLAKEVQRSLWHGIRKFEADLTAKFAHFRSEAKGEIRSDLQRDLRPMRDALSEYQYQTSKTVEQLSCSFQQWTKQNEALEQDRKRTAERELQDVMREIAVANQQFDTQIATVRREMTTLKEEIQNKARKESLFINGKADLISAVEKVKKDLETAINGLKQDFKAFQQIPKVENQSLTPLWTEIRSLRTSFQDEIQSKTAFLTNAIETSCSTLEEQVMVQVDRRIESQLRDIRVKLAVRTR